LRDKSVIIDECINNQITARMMQNYDFTSTDTFSISASTDVRPSEQVVQNIMSFARSYQTVEVEGMPIDLFLN
jgi:hypothetical protein